MTQIQENLFNHLKEIGLMPKIDEDGDIIFKYQMLNFCIILEERDELFLRLALPNIYSTDENNRIDVLEACNAVTLRIKVAKCFITPGGGVWIVTEQLLDSDPNFEDIVPRSLRILLDARETFAEAINN